MPVKAMTCEVSVPTMPRRISPAAAGRLSNNHKAIGLIRAIVLRGGANQPGGASRPGCLSRAFALC